MKLFICGGGSGERILEATKQFGSLLDKSKPLLYVPLAMESFRYPSCLEWITKEMSSINITNIEMVTSGAELARKKLNDYCAIFIGGGNTYKLLNDMKCSGAFEKVKDYIINGGIIFGGSAGAIILGFDIDTCKYEDDNESIGLKDTSGFNILNDISLLCHLNKKEEQTRINEEYLSTYSKNRKVFYLPERDTIFINNDEIILIGDEEFAVFKEGIKTIIDPKKIDINDII